jgi:hypothetical protein
MVFVEIRAGRHREYRLKLADGIVDACVEVLGATRQWVFWIAAMRPSRHISSTAPSNTPSIHEATVESAFTTPSRSASTSTQMFSMPPSLAGSTSPAATGLARRLHSSAVACATAITAPYSICLHT